MGYYIRKLSWKKSNPQWKLQFVSYKNSDIKGSQANKPKKEWDIEKNRWRSLGFHSGMSEGDARVRAKQLNAQRNIREQELRIQKNRRLEQLEQRKNEFCLPIEFITEFEKRFLRVRDSETESGKRKRSRSHIIWRAAQKTIAAIQIEPSEWFYHTHEIYDHFHRQRYSVRYIHAILKFMNLWGFVLCKKLSLPFLGIPIPRGYERARLIEANYEKQAATVRRASLPLSPDDLLKVTTKLNHVNLNWLYLSIWLELRPQEVDNLHNKEMWKFEKNPNGFTDLMISKGQILENISIWMGHSTLSRTWRSYKQRRKFHL